METDHGSREASSSELLKYKISYNDDGTLQWDPPTGSKELAVALSYHFPEEKEMKEKMRAAIKQFLRNERKAETDMAGEETTKPLFIDVEENYNEDIRRRTDPAFRFFLGIPQERYSKAIETQQNGGMGR
jgi:hypothetical protein